MLGLCFWRVDQRGNQLGLTFELVGEAGLVAGFDLGQCGEAGQVEQGDPLCDRGVVAVEVVQPGGEAAAFVFQAGGDQEAGGQLALVGVHGVAVAALGVTEDHAGPQQFAAAGEQRREQGTGGGGRRFNVFGVGRGPVAPFLELELGAVGLTGVDQALGGLKVVESLRRKLGHGRTPGGVRTSPGLSTLRMVRFRTAGGFGNLRGLWGPDGSDNLGGRGGWRWASSVRPAAARRSPVARVAGGDLRRLSFLEADDRGAVVAQRKLRPPVVFGVMRLRTRSRVRFGHVSRSETAPQVDRRAAAGPRVGRGLEDDEVVSVNDGLISRPAQHAGELVAAFALDESKFVGGVVGEAAGDLAAVGVAEHDDVAPLEAAGEAGDAGGQEAGGLFEERLGGAGVDGDGARGAGGEADPALAAVEASLGGGEDGTELFAGEQAGEDVGGAAVGDDGELAGFDGDAGGFEFGLHAAAAPGAFFAADELKLIDDLVDAVDDLAAFVQQARDAGEQDEGVGFEGAAGERGEQVVVAETDFFDGDGVVLIEDGDGAQLVEPGDAVADVEVAQAVVEVGPGEQDLAGAPAVLGQGVVPVGHEGALADGGDGLLLGDVGGAGFAAQLDAAGAHGAATDEGDVDFLFGEGGDLGGDAGDEGGVHRGLGFARGAAGDELGADLDHDVLGVAQAGLAEFGGGHGRRKVLEV